jgi:cell division protein FtsI/penicillin-binding protein 2
VQSGIAPLSSIINTYTRMGYSVNGQAANTLDLDGITINPASTTLSDSNNFETQWGALGQGKTLVSPYQLMLWQGAIANGTGSAVQPYLVRARTTPTGETVSIAVQRTTPQLFSAAAAQGVKDVETQNATDHYYVSFDGYSCGCKSGTAQVNDGGREYENSLLAGFCLDDRAPVAFCILIEERQSWDITTAQIARILLDNVSGIS